MPSTFTLQNSINHVLTIVRGELLNGSMGIANEPALTIGNQVKTKIQSPPFAWSWNRTILQFLLAPGTQDYLKAISTFGWLELAECAQGALITNTASSGGNATLTAVNNFKAGQLVNIQGTTGGGGILNVLGAAVQSPNLTSFGIANALGDISSGADTGTAIVQGSSFEAKQKNFIGRDLSPGGGRPGQICILLDDDNGNVTFRFHMTPDQPYLATLNYQRQIVPFTGLSDTWTPCPDARMQGVYMAGFKALCFQKARPELFLPEYHNFLALLVAMSEGLTEQQKDNFMRDEIAKMRTAQELSVPQARNIQ